MRTIRIIARHTRRSLFRSGRFALCAAVLWMLLLLGLALSVQQHRRDREDRRKAQALSRRNWLGQTPKNPHKAAHFGNFAYRLPTPLSLFDNGLNNFTGTSIYLEPHKSDNFQFSPAEDATEMLRFGDLTPAFVLQVIFPLLLIFITFSTMTEEREKGTLKLLLGQGAGIRQIAAGKSLGFFQAVGLILTPFFLLLACLPDFKFSVDNCLRLLLMLLSYGVFTASVIIFSVIISAHSSVSSQALMKLLSGWVITCILLPKLAGDAGSFFVKSPSQYTYATLVKQDEENGLNGHDPHDKRRAVLLAAVLKKYQVSHPDSLPVNFDAIAMVESEKYTTEVYRKRMNEVRAIFDRQNQFATYSAIFNPYQAIQSSSTALSGTDFFQFGHFQDQAEDYRLYFVNHMNEFMATHTKSGDWSTPFGKAVFETIRPFQYKEPTVREVIANEWLPFIALALLVPFCLILLLTLKSSPL